MSLLLLLTSCLPVLISAHVNVVLIGATGNLANRYLLSAFFDQMITGEELYLIPAAARDEKAGQESMNEAIKEIACIEEDIKDPQLGTCAEQKARVEKRVLSYKQLDCNEEEQWKDLAKFINSNAGKKRVRSSNSANAETGRLVYLSIPPHFVGISTDYINKHLRPAAEGAWLRVVIEKPFGRDQEEADDMAAEIAKNLKKEEILRNDHFLSKAGLKAIIDLHSLNPGFEERLHRNNLKRVEVGMFDKSDASDDPIYYDHYGVIRDVMQSHLTELAVAVAMNTDPYADDGGQSHRDTKSETVSAMQAGVVDGQHYVAQYAGYDEQLAASLTEEEHERSSTPTYAFVTMYFDEERWTGVPFVLAAGKKMAENKVFVRYVFQDNGYIEIVVDSDEAGTQIKMFDHVTKFDDAYIDKGWDDWTDTGVNEHDERVLVLNRKDDHNPYWYVVKHALEGDRTKFVDDEDLSRSWNVWTSVLEKIDEVYGHDPDLIPVYGHNTTNTTEIDITSELLGNIDYMIEHLFPEGNFNHGQEHEEL